MTGNDRASSASPFRPWDRFATVRGFALVGTTLIGLYLCYLLARPFLAALTWALTIAVLAAPLHRRVARWIKSPELAAGLSVAVLALGVLLPLALLGHHLVGVLVGGITSLQEYIASNNLQRTIESYPLLVWASSLIDGQDLTTVFGNVAKWLTNLAGSVMRESLSNVLVLLLTF